MTGLASILIADDEEKILTALRRALEREGYDVVATTRGREAAASSTSGSSTSSSWTT